MSRMHEEFGEAMSEGDKRIALLTHPFVFTREEAFEEVAEGLEGVLFQQLGYEFTLSVFSKRRREVSVRALLKALQVEASECLHIAIV